VAVVTCVTVTLGCGVSVTVTLGCEVGRQGQCVNFAQNFGLSRAHRHEAHALRGMSCGTEVGEGG
jgi:hypothetical protein